MASSSAGTESMIPWRATLSLARAGHAASVRNVIVPTPNAHAHTVIRRSHSDFPNTDPSR